MANLAKVIRTSEESQELELANYDKAQVVALVSSAFSEPIEAPEYIRISFVVGGGKKVRQKYREQLPKELIDALRDIGYNEDRAASACEQCQGTYKYQHDTDKDLKYVHVFPKMLIKKPEDTAHTDVDEEGIRIAGMRIEEMPPEILCAVCPLEVFVGLMGQRCPTFSQRRSMLRRLKEVQMRIKGLEERMIRMETLSKEDQELYENAVDIPAKLESLTMDMEAMIEQGHLSKAEIAQLGDEVTEKLSALDNAIEAATAEGKKTTKLEAQRTTLATRKEKLAQATPVVHQKPHAQEVMQLRKRLRGLEAKANGPNAKLDDLVKLSSIGANLKSDIERLEELDRGWFEDEIPREKKPERTTHATAPVRPTVTDVNADAGWSTVSKGKKK